MNWMVLAMWTLSSPVPWAMRRRPLSLAALVRGCVVFVDVGVLCGQAEEALGVDGVVVAEVGDGGLRLRLRGSDRCGSWRKG